MEVKVFPQQGKLVFIFGAGASKAEGAPSSDQLLVRSLKQLRNNKPVLNILDFLKDFFYARVDDLKLDKIPTFEELLTLIDISLSRQDDLSRKWNYKKLTELRNDLIYCIAKILDRTLKHGGRLHEKFVDELFELSQRNNKNTSFISLNYDILLDNRLIDLYVKKDWDIDYGIEFRNFVKPIERKPYERLEFTQIPDEWHWPRKDRAIYLLKLHGSLNWLYCPNCNTVKITKKEKGALRIWTEFETCEIDGSLQRPLIVPPTWQKAYENPHLSRIWLKAAEVLRQADEVIFIGYSLPDSDIRMKYLSKKFLFRNNASMKPKISAVLMQDEKTEEIEKRYKRIFGQDVNVVTEGFENFVNNLDKYI